MMVSPVLGSRAIFDQSLHGSPMTGPLATADVVIGGADGGGGGIGAGAAGRALAEGGLTAGAVEVGEAVTGRSCCR